MTDFTPFISEYKWIDPAAANIFDKPLTKNDIGKTTEQIDLDRICLLKRARTNCYLIIKDTVYGQFFIKGGNVLNLDTLTWEISAEKQTALFAETQTRLIANINENAANYEGECSRYISDFTQRARLANKTATNLILTQSARLEKLQIELSNQRMYKYKLKTSHLILDQLQSIHNDIIKQNT
ncbi:hypothetical protein BV006_01118 [Haemophilus influenzae]|nr:hypothetical protein BV166_01746 [Haemophilus influenzae]PRK62782.1 hypothetical protein BV167_00287 [Haemophilus influenzae]PRM08073.1 hypothetical protein BV006_01118 [Haemophilus influenzae]